MYKYFRINLPHSKQNENNYTTAQTILRHLKHCPDRRTDTLQRKNRKSTDIIINKRFLFFNTISPHFAYLQSWLQLVFLLNNSVSNLFPCLKHFTVLHKHLGQTYLTDVSGVQLETLITQTALIIYTLSFKLQLRSKLIIQLNAMTSCRKYNS